jgi:hypothetical protein
MFTESRAPQNLSSETMTTLRSVALRVIPLASVVLMAVVPAAASAQGRGGIIRDDLADFDPVQHFLSKKKDLKLDDAQQKQLSVLQAPLKKTRDSLFTKIDSAQRTAVLRVVGVPLGSALPAQPRNPTFAQIEQTHRDIDDMLIVLRQAYGQSANDALTLLTAEQRPKAQGLLEKLSAEMAKTRMGKASR